MSLRYTAGSFRIWLQAEIDRREWSRAKLADQAGVSKATVERWLSASATIKPSLPSINKLADLFDRDADEIAAIAGIHDRWAEVDGSVLASSLPSGGEMTVYQRKDGLLDIGYERAPVRLAKRFSWAVTANRDDIDALVELLKEAQKCG